MAGCLPAARGIPVNAELENKLLKKAGLLLARRAYSRGDLRMKLLKTADDALVENVLDHLQQQALLNDENYAYNFALSRVGREGWGPEKIKSALMRHHVSPSDISSALDRVRDEIGNDYALADYVNKYLGKKGIPTGLKGTRNLIAHLRRRGYDRNTIIGALKHKLPSEMLRYFETGD